jgi:hypothetical protein
MTNAHSKTGKMVVHCQNMMLGALSSHSMRSVLVGVLFKKLGLFLNMPYIAATSNVSNYLWLTIWGTLHVLVSNAKHICKIYVLSVKYLMIRECAS